jgi:hypothetical protein
MNGFQVDAVNNALDELRAEVEWLTVVLTAIHDDARCPSWICKHIEIILQPEGLDRGRKAGQLAKEQREEQCEKSP